MTIEHFYFIHCKPNIYHTLHRNICRKDSHHLKKTRGRSSSTFWWCCRAIHRVCWFAIGWLPAGHQNYNVPNVSDVWNHLQSMVHHGLLESWEKSATHQRRQHSQNIRRTVRFVICLTCVSALSTLIVFVEINRSTSVIGWDSPSGA